MANNRFASVPNISIPRSRFKQPFNHSTSFNHGQLVPIDCFDILPGDTYKIDLAAMVWMSNPIRPIFGNITAHVDVFFVPMRLVWDYTKEFFGENKTSSGYQTGTYKIPSTPLGYSTYGSNVEATSLSHYLGKPICKAFTLTNTKNVSVLKERGYYSIWNNFYRSEQLQNPVLIVTGGNGSYNNERYIGTLDGSYLFLRSGLLNVNKEFDYFTAATLSPQYGAAVSIPLGSYAPVMTTAEFGGSTGLARYTGQIYYASTTTGAPTSGTEPVFGSSGQIGADTGGNAIDGVRVENFVADLSNATAATINSLRYAFAVQKYLERSNFGSRFFEMLNVHYGVTSPDATLQIPQRIGHADFPINISTVLSTAGAAADTSTELGMPGATSCTGTKKYLCTHAFTEPGFLYVLINTTHERSYSQGILREDLKTDRFEIYSPEFANLGDQEILNCEIYYGNDTSNDDVFGYQEHWAEYRYRPHRVSGILDPQAANALDFWVLTDDYGNVRPSLSGSWLQENRNALARCLVTGSTGPDYIADFMLPYVATREMPLFTIPGLIDHFGSR